MGVVNFAPQSGNIDLYDVAEFFPVIVIEVLEQFCLRDHSARAMPQIFEDAIFHGSQRDFPVSPADGSCHCVQLKIADGNHRGVLSSASPDQCFGAREKLTQIKGFCHVVIRAGIEQFDDGFFLVPKVIGGE